jgi:low temperature requirement protein LtrA
VSDDAGGTSVAAASAATDETGHGVVLRPPVLRSFQGERHASWLELFFDLCFVAAVAALAAGLRETPTTEGLLRFAGLFVPVWWGWMGYTWYATAFDTDDVVFRLGMLGAMLSVIVLAASIPGVAEGRSTGFVLAYAALQLLLAGLFARSWRHVQATRPLSSRYAIGDALGAAIWLSSLLAPAEVRPWLWGLAMVVLMTAPVLAVRALELEAFDPGHIPERYGLFTLIVLGESIVAATAGASDTHGDVGAALVAVAGFLLAACIWWVYFEFVKSSSLSRDHLLPAFIWGYGHLLIFGGIAAAASGVELAVHATVEHHPMTGPERAALCGGLIAYLVAISAIHLVTVKRWDAVLGLRLCAAGVLAVLAAAGGGLDPRLLMALVLATVLAATLSEILRAARAARRVRLPVRGPSGP